MSHDTDTLDRFLTDLAECPDLTDIVADGGVTAGMVFQQQARWMRAVLARVLGDQEALKRSNDLHIKTTQIVVDSAHTYRLRAVAAEARSTPVYSAAVGDAGEAYMKEVHSAIGGTHLSGTFRYAELFDRMVAAASTAP